MVGLGAGPHFLAAVRESGIGLLLGGLVVFRAAVFGLCFGRFVLKISPLLLLGAISGAQTFTPGWRRCRKSSDSSESARPPLPRRSASARSRTRR